MLNTTALFDEDLDSISSVPAVQAEASPPALSLVPPTNYSGEEPEDDALDTPLSDIGAERKMVIETPLYDIHFKVGQIGHTKVRGNEPKLVAPLAMLDAIADKEIMRVAYRSLELQIALFGKEAAVSTNPPKASSAFDPVTGELKSEFAGNLTISQKQSLEQRFAEAALSIMTVKAIARERDEMFPFARDALQLAYVTNTPKPAPIRNVVTVAEGEGKKTSIEEAIEYRRTTCTLYRGTVAQVAKSRLPPDPDALSGKTALELLGF